MIPPKHILATNFLSVPRTYFNNTAKQFLEMAQKGTATTITYRIAGTPVRVHYYGATAAREFSLAFSHHPLTEEEPVLTIHAWDTSAAGSLMPAPWNDPQFDGSKKHDEDFHGVYVSGEESLNFYDPKTKTGYFWVHDASRMPDWSLGAPFRTILHWFLNDINIHFLHGAVVGQNGKSVLLTAKSGSGKSTTALSCLLSGMEYVGDDYVAVTSTPPITAYSLYSSAKVTRNGVNQFPELGQHIWNQNFGEQEKAVMFLSGAFEKQIRESLPLTAILIPKITGNETRIIKASKAEALVAAAPTTLLQLPLAETNKLFILKKIIEQIPCYFLELGPDIREIPLCIKDFLASEKGV